MGPLKGGGLFVIAAQMAKYICVMSDMSVFSNTTQGFAFILNM